PVVAPLDLARERAHLPGLRGKVAREERLVAALADEADAGAVRAVVVRQPGGARQGAHLGLGQLAERKQRARERASGHGAEKVALVLGAMARLEQPRARGARRQARVMAGGDALGAERERVLEERLELDLAVAQHVGIRGAPGAVLVQKMTEHPLPVLGGEVDRAQG